MSQHDLRDDYDDEPWRGRPPADSIVKAPADWMWSCGMFQLGATLLVLFVVVGSFVERWETGRPLDRTDIEAVLIFGSAGLAGIGIAVVVLRGSTAMRTFRRYPWAVAAALLTALSLPCVVALPFAGPIGVWALAVLRQADVRSRFAVMARGNIKSAPPEAPDARRTDAP